MQQFVGNYAVGLGTLSISGAGLVYSTLFGYASVFLLGLCSWACSQRKQGKHGPRDSHISILHSRISDSRLCVYWDTLGRKCSQGNAFYKPSVLDRRHIVGVPLWKPTHYDTEIVNTSLNLFGATLMVVSAIAIVNLTIFQLRFDRRASFTLIETAGIISFAFSGYITAVAFMTFLVGLFSRKFRKSVRKYFEGIISKERNALNTYDHVWCSCFCYWGTFTNYDTSWNSPIHLDMCPIIVYQGCLFYYLYFLAHVASLYWTHSSTATGSLWVYDQVLMFWHLTA